MARVICEILRTDRYGGVFHVGLPRSISPPATAFTPPRAVRLSGRCRRGFCWRRSPLRALLEALGGGSQRGDELIAPRLASRSIEHSRAGRSQVVKIRSLKRAHLFHRHVLEEAVGRHPERRNFLLNRQRSVLRLLENLSQTLTTIELRFGHRIEIRAELRERGERADTAAMSRRRRPATLFIARICAAPPTRETEMPTFTAGRMPA